MIFPLKDVTKINERLDAVAFLILQSDLRKELAHAIKACGDIERLVSKIPNKKINPREVMHLAKGLEQTSLIKTACIASTNPYLQRLGDALNGCQLMVDRILAEITETPPVAVIKGGAIRAGVHAELDTLRNISTGGKEFLASIQQREAEKTGISSLKISLIMYSGIIWK